jgi:hypothetical protein
MTVSILEMAESSATNRQLALARLEAAIRLVDHIGATTATDYATIPVTVFKRLQRVADFHFGTTP